MQVILLLVVVVLLELVDHGHLVEEDPLVPVVQLVVLLHALW